MPVALYTRMLFIPGVADQTSRGFGPGISEAAGVSSEVHILLRLVSASADKRCTIFRSSQRWLYGTAALAFICSGVLVASPSAHANGAVTSLPQAVATTSAPNANPSWRVAQQEGNARPDDTIPPPSVPPTPVGDDSGSLTAVAARTATAATDQLDLALGQRQVYSDLLSLQDRIYDSQLPVTNAVSRYSTQSNDLNIFWEEISQDIFFEDGAARLRPGVQYIAYSPKGANGVIQDSIGSDGTYRFSDLSSISGDFWLNNVQPKNLPSAVIPTYDLFLTLLPSDSLRFDLDTKREIFDNIQSLQLGITAESVGGSVDYSPTDRLRLSLRGSGSFYSDTNDRQNEEAEAVWKVLAAPTLEIGVRASGFQFSKLLNDGYFNPRNYVSGEGMVRLQTDLTDNLNVELAASGGAENASPGGTKPLVKSSLQLVYKLANHWNLDGGISYFSSRESNSAGFARTSFTLGLHYKFD